MKNNNKTYGCELIQKMKQDIDKLKKDTFIIPCLVKIVLSLAGIIIFAFVVRTFIPSRSPETINYNIIVNKANENCKSKIRTEMAEALVKVEERAVNAYNDNFATLLTILTIFGIAWPVIIALLQFKFNESELNTIKQAQDNAQIAINKAEEAYNNNQDALKRIKKLSVITKDAYVKSLTHSRCLFRTFNVVFSSVATEKDSAYANYYHALGLRCLVFGIQASNEIEITEDYIETMVENVKLITPEENVTETSDSCLEFLVGCKDDLTKNINAKNSNAISQLGVFLHLLDEKIAEYEKLLVATDSDKQ